MWGLHKMGDRIRPWHLPPSPTSGEWMETFTLPCPSPSEEAPGGHQGFLHIPSSSSTSGNLLNKNLFWNISRISPLRPRQIYCKSNLAQGKMSVVSWSELRVSGQGLWVLIPAWPLNHFEPFASHFVLAPVSNFPSEWFSDRKQHFTKLEPLWKLTFRWGYLASRQGGKGH